MGKRSRHFREKQVNKRPLEEVQADAVRAMVKSMRPQLELIKQLKEGSERGQASDS